MIWIETPACIVALYVLGSIVIPLVTMIFVSWPIIQIGRWIRAVSLPMWFLSRYLSYAIDIAALLWLATVAATYLVVWTPALYVYVAILALQLFNTLYQFDVRLFESQSGPWAQAQDEAVA